MFTKDNEIIILDYNYMLIRGMKWQKLKFGLNSGFILDMKYFFLMRINKDQSNLKFYRGQITE